MEDKYLFALIGVGLGSLLTAVFAVAKEMFVNWLKNKKDAEYLAIRMICVFEEFMERCAAVVGDDGSVHGQFPPDGSAHAQVSTPELDLETESFNWKSLSHELMYEILYFPSLVADANNYIAAVNEHDSPPEYDETFEARQYRYAELGLKAENLTSKLRKKYKLKKNHFSNWDIVSYMQSRKRDIEGRIAQREGGINEIMNR